MFEQKKKPREITHIIRIFSDGEAEVLQGKLLKAYLERLRIIENILDDYGGRDIDPFRHFWVPIEVPKIKVRKIPKGASKAGR